MRFPRTPTILLLLTASGIARDEQTLATAFLRVWRGQDEAGAQNIVGQSRGVEWQVTNAILSLGENEAAHAYVGMLSNAETRRALAAYLALPSSRPNPRDLTSLENAREARLAGSPIASLDQLRATSPCSNILGVLIEEERGRAYRELGDRARSAIHMLLGADHAHAIRWDCRRDAILKHVFRDASLAASGWPLGEQSIARAKRSLGKHDCLVSYVRVGSRLVALLVVGGQTSYVPLGEADEVAGACAELMATRGSVGAAALRELLILPLGLPPSVEKIVVVPMCGLAAVPLAAVVPGKELVYAPVNYVATSVSQPPSKDILQVVDDGLLGGMGAPQEEHIILRARNQRDLQALDAHLARSWRAIQIDLPYRPATDSLGAGLKVLRLLDLDAQADLLVFASSHSCRVRLMTGYSMLEGIEVQQEGGLERLEEALRDFRRRRESGEVGMRYLLDEKRPQILVSLWEIDVEATRALLQSFYGEWQGGSSVSASAALQAAQCAVRQDERWQHSRYWAGWQLWGNVFYGAD